MAEHRPTDPLVGGDPYDIYATSEHRKCLTVTSHGASLASLNKEADMTKHTPGPWTVSNPHGGANEVSAGDHVIASARPPSPGFQHPEMHANARLIAAAPELLAACQRALRDSERPGFSMDHAGVLAALRAAIAKATDENVGGA